MQFWTLTFLLLMSTSILAGEIHHLSVQHKDGIYTLDLNVVIDARQPLIWAIATDYANSDLLSDIIVKSEIIDQDNNKTKRRLVTKFCILFFCANTVLVENITEISDTLIVATIDETQSDYEYGITQWRVIPEGQEKTRILLHNKIKPAFWIPPVIGPLLLERELFKEAGKTIKRFESLAADG